MANLQQQTDVRAGKSAVIQRQDVEIDDTKIELGEKSHTIRLSLREVAYTEAV